MNDDNFKKTPEPEKRNENDNGIFRVTTSFTWILTLSIVILLLAGVFIYAAYKDALTAEIWQLAIWCVCVLLAFYSIVKRSLAATILNFILFFVVSMIPVWELGRENFKSVFKLFFG